MIRNLRKRSEGVYGPWPRSICRGYTGHKCSKSLEAVHGFLKLRCPRCFKKFVKEVKAK